MSGVASREPERAPRYAAEQAAPDPRRDNVAVSDGGVPSGLGVPEAAGGRPRPDRTAGRPQDRPAGTGTLLVIDDLQVTARTSRGDMHVVDGVSLSLEQGRLLAVVGESGSGKSVTARSVLGLLPRQGLERSRGRVLIDGADILGRPEPERRKLRGRRVSMVFQNPSRALNPFMRVGDQIALPMRQHLGLRGPAARLRVIELLAEVGIPDPEARCRSYPHEMSGGMCQRVMLAIALSCEPDLLIADEPTTALDVTVQAQVLRLIHRLRTERGMAVMLITHDLSIVRDYADDVAVMYAGRVVEAAPAGELFHHPRMPYTRGLLESVPTIDQDRSRPLRGIRGRPPVIIGDRRGCAFAPRCPHATEQCEHEDPRSVAWTPVHSGACWHPQDAPLATESR